MKSTDLCLSVIFSIFIAGCAGQDIRSDKKTDNSAIGPASETVIVKTSAATAEAQQPSPEPTDAITLAQVLALTTVGNPELKMYSWELRSAQARELYAGLWPNPTLEVGVEDIGGSGSYSGFDVAETTISISQLLELGDKSQKRKNVAALERQMSGFDYEIKRQDILAQAGKAYIELLAVQERARLLTELVLVSQETLRSVSQRVDAGKDSPLEKTRASVALAGVEVEQKQVALELELARKLLASFWGSDMPKFTQAQGQLASEADIPASEQLMRDLMLNPRLSRLESEVGRDRAILELEQAGSIPDITVGGGVKRFSETDENAFVVNFAIPLQVSDRNQSGKMVAAANLNRTYEQQKATRLALLDQFNQVYTELSISLARARELRKTILPGAKEVFTAAQTAYAQGKIDYLNLLDAQRTYYLYQREYVDSLVDYHLAKFEMERLIGHSIESQVTTNNGQRN